VAAAKRVKVCVVLCMRDFVPGGGVGVGGSALFVSAWRERVSALEGAARRGVDSGCRGRLALC